MKHICLIVYSIMLSPLSVSQPTQKFCINCKFYKKSFFTMNEYGKCSLYPKEDDIDYSFVTGNNYNKNIDYHYCSTSRKFEDMCGKEGKFYEEK